MSEKTHEKEKFNDPEVLDNLQQIAISMEEGRIAYEKEVNEYWNSLSYDDKLKSFYAVVSRIHKGDILDKGSYRWVLYDVFGFGPDAYLLGMECGYMELHNAVVVE